MPAATLMRPIFRKPVIIAIREVFPVVDLVRELVFIQVVFELLNQIEKLVAGEAKSFVVDELMSVDERFSVWPFPPTDAAASSVICFIVDLVFIEGIGVVTEREFAEPQHTAREVAFDHVIGYRTFAGVEARISNAKRRKVSQVTPSMILRPRILSNK